MSPSSISSNFYLEKYAPKTISGLVRVEAHPVVGDGWVGLYPEFQMGLDIVANHPFHYFQELLFSKMCSKDSLWPCPSPRAHPGVGVGQVGLHPDGQRDLETQ